MKRSNPKQERYDLIGKDYANTRQTDKRIAAVLIECLALSGRSQVIDIGAGTGNYARVIAELGHFVTAVEPSATMISKAYSHGNIVWKQSSAEAIPFADATFDAAYCTLSMHHFANLQQSLAEIFRVLKPGGRWVSFTADPRRLADGFWMPQYFGPLYDKVREVFPSSEELADDIRKASRSDRVEMRSFPLPHDLEDRFFCSAWRYPEKYLDPVFRRGISHFQLADPVQVQGMVQKLKQDLDSGLWDKKHGHIRTVSSLDCGYFFVYANKGAEA
jgi:ubiquinone/menaquinone biosynthesis C-methylase UbiE